MAPDSIIEDLVAASRANRIARAGQDMVLEVHEDRHECSGSSPVARIAAHPPESIESICRLYAGGLRRSDWTLPVERPCSPADGSQGRSGARRRMAVVSPCAGPLQPDSILRETAALDDASLTLRLLAMKILLLAYCLPAPKSDGYNLRNHHYLKRLGAEHDIDMLAFDRGEFPAELEACVGEVERVPCGGDAEQGILRRAARGFSGRYLYEYSQQYEEALRARLARESYDVVWVGPWLMFAYAPVVLELGDGRPALVADPADDEVRATRIEYRKARWTLSFFSHYRAYFRILRFQRHFLSMFDLALFVSESDADSTRDRMPALRVEVLKNGVDSDFFEPQGSETDAAVLVFEGSMSFPPNVEGAQYLVREILPRVQAEIPEARVVLVGRAPAPEVLALASDHVTVTGTVPDVRDYLARGTVFACPLLGGSGIKNKILQAWAMEKAVVATTCSVTGLDARDGETLLLADDPGTFAERCVSLIRSRDQRESLGRRGREVVLEHHSWDSQAALFSDLLRTLEAHQDHASAT